MNVYFEDPVEVVGLEREALEDEGELFRNHLRREDFFHELDRVKDGFDLRLGECGFVRESVGIGDGGEGGGGEVLGGDGVERPQVRLQLLPLEDGDEGDGGGDADFDAPMELLHELTGLLQPHAEKRPQGRRQHRVIHLCPRCQMMIISNHSRI